MIVLLFQRFVYLEITENNSSKVESKTGKNKNENKPYPGIANNHAQHIEVDSFNMRILASFIFTILQRNLF